MQDVNQIYLNIVRGDWSENKNIIYPFISYLVESDTFP